MMKKKQITKQLNGDGKKVLSMNELKLRILYQEMIINDVN